MLRYALSRFSLSWRHIDTPGAGAREADCGFLTGRRRADGGVQARCVHAARHVAVVGARPTSVQYFIHNSRWWYIIDARGAGAAKAGPREGDAERPERRNGRAETAQISKR